MTRIQTWARSALAIPLFWKILLANAAVVAAAVLLGGALGHQLAETDHSTAGAVAVLAVAGVAMSLLVNAVTLRLALEPLERLEGAAARVQAGELDARAPDSPLADPALGRLGRTFNAALDALAASRRRVQQLLARSLEEEEEERRRVAHALEDETAQRLACLLMRLRLAGLSPDPEELEALVEETRMEIAAALDVVRGYAGGRRPAVLDELGLIAALEGDARRMMESGNLAVRIQGPAVLRVPPEIELMLYRVLGEALENAARHAAARSVEVRIACGDRSVVATVADDGRGFDPALADDEHALGLGAMRERAEGAGGRVSVSSAPGQGTRVLVEVPVARPVPVA